ncbi:MAG: hypothetical protein IJC48_07255 [Clostridia bacterium]|nr:hypothetical protein [Clostridia bacterium]
MTNAETEKKTNTKYEFEIQMLLDAQALSVKQRVTYRNDTGKTLSSILFSVYANAFRRESALPYDNDSLEAAFPYGYAPGGIEFREIYLDGEIAEWGIQGANETFISVACSLAPGETAVIEFYYVLLLTKNRAFLGAGDTDWRITNFYPSVCPYENGAFVTNPITRAGEFLYADPSDFTVYLTLPDGYIPAFNGNTSDLGTDETGRFRTYKTEIANARALAFAISRKFHILSAKTAYGTNVSVYGQDRSKMKDVLKEAVSTLENARESFGAYPRDSLSIALTDMQNETITSSGLIFMSSDADRDLPLLTGSAVMKQYFGDIVMPNPGSEAWLAEAVSRYAWMLLIEKTEGERAFTRLLNAYVLPSLSVTIPGGLLPHMETMYFTSGSDYEAVVCARGCAVLNEIRFAMGNERFLSSIRTYYEDNSYKNPTTDDLILSMNKSAGGQWQNAVYGWLNTVDEYAGEWIGIYE